LSRHYPLCLSVLFLNFWLFSAGVAAEKKKSRAIDGPQKVRLNYQKPQWNQSATKVDSATVLVRDSKTGKSVQIQLNETTSDSGEFSGQYNINWNESKGLDPEVYVPQNSTGQIDRKTNQTTEDMIRSNQVKRMPFIMRPGDNGERVMQVYNSKQEATEALKAYRAASKAKPKADENLTDSILETAERAKLNEELRKLSAEARANAELRKKMLEEQARDRAQKQAEFNSAPASEKEKRRKAAEEFAKEGMDFFRSNQFGKASEMFKKSTELDPTNNDVLFSYGASQYKIDKFNESLVTLEMAKEGKFNKNERDFYKALNYYKLNDNSSALNTLRQLKASKDPSISPTATFYEGLVLFKEAKFDDAKNSFQEVLDTSTDPALDEKAEDYIEQIEKAKAFAKNKQKTWFFTLTAGMQYDSNVLLVNSSSSSASDPSQVADTRALSGVSGEYRFIYNKEHELSAKAKADVMYSSKAANVGADPQAYSLKLPYKYKGMLFEKGFSLTATPGYEVLYLDENRSGANKSYFQALGEKELFLTSYTADFVNTFVMNQDWFTGFTIKLRTDTSSSTVATGDSDPSAFKYTLTYNNMYFLNQAKNQGLLGDLGYTNNKSKGRNLTFARYDVSVTYLHPLPFEIQGIAQIAYYLANYNEKSGDARRDSNMTYLLNFSRPIVEWLSVNLGGNYVNNASTLTANTYNKFTVTGTLTANYSF
jgi:hypothetical protein